jgi:hypothetical protein
MQGHMSLAVMSLSIALLITSSLDTFLFFRFIRRLHRLENEAAMVRDQQNERLERLVGIISDLQDMVISRWKTEGEK